MKNRKREICTSGSGLGWATLPDTARRAAIVPVSPHAGVIQRSAPSQLRSLGSPPSGTSLQRGDETCFEKVHRDCHHGRNRCSFARMEEHHGA